jgi:AraC family transcriptional regulator
MLRRTGLKYESHQWQSRASAFADWDGLSAEVRLHDDTEVPGFVQPDLEVAVAINGTAVVTCHSAGKAHERIARPGTIWICPPGTDVDSVRSRGGSLEVLHLYLSHDLMVRGGLDDFGVVEGAGRIAQVGGVQDPLIEQIARTVHTELTNGKPASRVLISALGLALAARLVQAYVGGRATELGQTEQLGGLSRRRIEQVIHYISSNLQGEITIEGLAAVACLSRFHFARAFKVSTGQSPHQFVAAMRMDRAKELLVNRAVGDVADVLHFSSTRNFVRAFRRVVGQTPGEFVSGLRHDQPPLDRADR